MLFEFIVVDFLACVVGSHTFYRLVSLTLLAHKLEQAQLDQWVSWP